ncbi:hypothetical protein GCM10023346_04880 [Arthrobacter gyeryongensis]|uniref:Uncharacterized protein n=1 Tax=Arthrobacter gyeryongensis TaxID=1650592 RepID=A0ABP9S048_9MICC
MADVEPEMAMHDGVKEQLREHIARRYLESPDFNGVEAPRLIDALGEFPVDIEAVLAELVAEGVVYANFGHEMTNPHIIGFPHQPAADNLTEVQQRGGVCAAVLYPTRDTLAAMSADDRYPGAPYSAALALGRSRTRPCPAGICVLPGRRSW